MKKIIIFLICIILLCSCGKKEEKEKCIPFDGGRYKISFESNGGNEINPVEVCVGCPDSEIIIEEPIREGYEFGGWFYDNLFLMKFSGNKTTEIEVKYEHDDNGCNIKYKDIILYALWYKN